MRLNNFLARMGIVVYLTAVLRFRFFVVDVTVKGDVCENQRAGFQSVVQFPGWDEALVRSADVELFKWGRLVAETWSAVVG